MPDPTLLKALIDFSNTPGATPEAALGAPVNGQLRINQADGRLYSRRPDGTSRVTDIRAIADQIANGPLATALRQAGQGISVRSIGATGDGVTDDTDAIQAAIDALPASGGVLFFPETSINYQVRTLRLDGSTGGKSNVVLYGQGKGSQIVQVAGAGATGNILTIKGGSGHRISGLSLVGDLGRGTAPVRGTGFWAPGVAYAVGDYAETLPNGTSPNSDPYNVNSKVWKCTVAHTSTGTTIDQTKFVETTERSNTFLVDSSYNTRNGIFIDTCSDVIVTDCTIRSVVYSAFNIGPGALQPNLITAGASDILIANNQVIDCENGVAGGRQVRASIVGNKFRGIGKLGIYIDFEAHDCVVDGNTVSCATTAQYGIYALRAYNFVFSSNTVDGPFFVGINIENDCNIFTITGNSTRGSDKGITISQSYNFTVSGNAASFSPFYGIWVRGSSDFTVAGNTCRANNLEGIRCDNCNTFTIGTNTVTSNGGLGGVILTACFGVSITGVIAIANGALGDPLTAGIRGIDTTSVVITGVVATDYAASGSKKQKYGVLFTGASGGIYLNLNHLAGNQTEGYNLSGGGNLIVSAVAATSG